MHNDFRKLVRAAAPRPSASPDVEAMWERAGRQRMTRRIVAASVVVVTAALAVGIVQAGYLDRPGDKNGSAPAGFGRDDPSDPGSDALGTLYLENLCRDIGDCTVTVADLDAGTSRTVPLPELALGDSQFRIVRVGSKLVFRGSTSHSTGSDVATFAMELGVLASHHPRLDLAERPRNIGDSWYFAPSAVEGRVWLAILDPESPGTVRALAGVKEVTADGEVTVPYTPLPSDRWSSLVGAVSGGLVFQGADGLEVWDPSTRTVALRVPGPFAVATRGNQIAWCDFGCEEVHVTDLATAEDIAIAPEGGFAFEETYYGAFSPDGSLLAVPVSGDGGRRVALIDVERGTSNVIDESVLDESYGFITWSSSGDRLFFNAGNAGVMTYEIGSESAEFLSVDTGGPYFGIAAD